MPGRIICSCWHMLISIWEIYWVAWKIILRRWSICRKQILIIRNWISRFIGQKTSWIFRTFYIRWMKRCRPKKFFISCWKILFVLKIRLSISILCYCWLNMMYLWVKNMFQKRIDCLPNLRIKDCWFSRSVLWGVFTKIIIDRIVLCIIIERHAVEWIFGISTSSFLS